MNTAISLNYSFVAKSFSHFKIMTMKSLLEELHFTLIFGPMYMPRGAETTSIQIFTMLRLLCLTSYCVYTKRKNEFIQIGNHEMLNPRSIIQNRSSRREKLNKKVDNGALAIQ